MILQAPQDFKYDIYLIGAPGPPGVTPGEAAAGSTGAHGQDAS